MRLKTAQVRTLQRKQRSVWDLMERKENQSKIYDEAVNDREKNTASETVAHRSKSD